MVAPSVDPCFLHLPLVEGCYKCLSQEVLSVWSCFSAVTGKPVCSLVTGDASVGGILVCTKARLQDPDSGVRALSLIILSKGGLYLVILENTPEPAFDVSSNRSSSCGSDDDTPGSIAVLGDEKRKFSYFCLYLLFFGIP